MYKEINGFRSFAHSGTLLDLKLCHKIQTGMVTMETCILVRSI